MRTNKMKILAILVILVILAVMTVTAQAKEVLIETEVSSISAHLDKNGNEYIRLIVKEDRELNGIKYEVGIPVMSFGETAGQVKNLVEGDVLKAICSQQEYKGRKTYQLIAIIE